MMKNLQNILPKFFARASWMCLLVMGLLSSCWAPRCPMETCRSKYEHSHSDQVAGVFSPRYGVPFKMHFLWDIDKGESNPNTEFEPGTDNKKQKTKKRYPWEKW
jgi:hypothetical protein